MCRQKLFFEECPKRQCNELNDEIFKRMEEFYEYSYKSSFIHRIIIDMVCSLDRTLLTLIVGSMTSLSINLATGFIDLEKVNFNAEFIFRICQFVFALGFNFCTICFTTKVINIQEYGEEYYPEQKISKDIIIKSQKNVMFNACIENEKKLKRFLLLGGACIIVVILSVPFRSVCIKEINQIMLLFGRLWKNFNAFIGR